MRPDQTGSKVHNEGAESKDLTLLPADRWAGGGGPATFPLYGQTTKGEEILPLILSIESEKVANPIIAS
jgi:hypothetical protein